MTTYVSTSLLRARNHTAAGRDSMTFPSHISLLFLLLFFFFWLFQIYFPLQCFTISHSFVQKLNRYKILTSRYEEEEFDVTEWGRGYQEEPEEDWRSRGYAQPEEEWRGHGYDQGYDRSYDHGRDRGYDHGHDGYEQGYDHGYNQGYEHREEEEEDRERGAGYQYTEPEDEPRVTPDESLFRWLAVSYASTHLTMTHNFRGSCHGDPPTGALGIVNRAKWNPVTGSE